MGKLNFKCQFKTLSQPTFLRAGGDANVCINTSLLEIEKQNFDQGSSCRVYKGKLRHLDGKISTVAVKEFLVWLTRKVERNLKEETQELLKLSHPNILIHYGMDFSRCCLVTEYIEKNLVIGSTEWSVRSVRDLLDAYSAKDVLLEWNKRIDLAVQAARGLAFLHNSEVLHGDIKAGNITRQPVRQR